MKRSLLAGLLLAATACGGADGSVTFDLDTRALSGVASVTIDVYSGTDVDGAVVGCAEMVAGYQDPSRFVQVAPSQLADVYGGPVTVTFEQLEEGPAYFLVLGWAEPEALGAVTHVGCGEAQIVAGEKATVPVALQPVP